MCFLDFLLFDFSFFMFPLSCAAFPFLGLLLSWLCVAFLLSSPCLSSCFASPFLLLRVTVLVALCVDLAWLRLLLVLVLHSFLSHLLPHRTFPRLIKVTMNGTKKPEHFRALAFYNVLFKAGKDYLPSSMRFFKSANTPRSPRDVPAATF